MGDVTCEVVIIGAGLCGISAAKRLIDRDVSVVVLEAREISSAASGRNAGFLLQGIAERYDRASAIMGRERAKLIHEWSVENHRMIAQTVAELTLDCAYKQGGSLQLAGNEQEEAELVRSADLLSDDGFKAIKLTRGDLPASLQRAGYQMGVLLPTDGELHPAKFVRGVANHAQTKGVRIFENSPVTSLDCSGAGDVLATTTSGSVRASIGILATNARAAELIPQFRGLVDPVRGQMLATAPTSPLFERPVYANHGYDYWRQLDSGQIVLGGWRNIDPNAEVGHEERLHDEIQHKMTSFVHSLGVRAEITHRWSGIMGFSKDGLGLVGAIPSSPSLLAGVGFTGHGFGFAYAAGHALADMVLDGKHPLCEALDPRRLTK
jgi:glycine/D-amino acid oxidase-like deaminating enzyme